MRAARLLTILITLQLRRQATAQALADQLAAALPTATLRTFEGLSHYSTLRAALPEIFAGLE